jgi:hypothetical protein
MPSVNWIVPLRRAVVRGECSYVELLRAWAHELRDSNARLALARWYPAAGENRCLRGSTWVDAVIAGMGAAAARPASVEQGNTMDLPLPAWVRLWKGPRRVLYHPVPGAGPGDPESDVSLRYDNDNREVRNPSARFYPGDVVEFPIFRFLAVCLNDRSSLAQQYMGMRFNGRGHPALGNTVLLSDGSVPTGDASLHDNILAMRFQLLLSLAVGGWYHSGPVWANDATGRMGNWGRERVWTRGMMYAGEFAIAGRTRLAGRGVANGGDFTHTTSADHSNFWRFATWHWGEARGTRTRLENVPTTASLARLRPEQVLTPGWACSPATLALTYFMRNAPTSGSDSVNATMGATAPTDPAIRFITREQIVDAGTARDATARPDLIPCTLAWADGRRCAWGGPVGDVNVVGLSAHEQAFVKIYPPSRLMLRDLPEHGRPYLGFLSAFNPVTGEDYFTESEFASVGQLYRFEASGTLKRTAALHGTETEEAPQELSRDRFPILYGVGQFIWEPIANNTVYLKRLRAPATTGGTGGRVGRDLPQPNYGMFFSEPSAGQRPGMWMNRIIAIDLVGSTTDDTMRPGNVYRPIVIGANNGRDTLLSRNGSADDYKGLYAERAVPFMTYGEHAAGAAAMYPAVSAIRADIEAANDFYTQNAVPVDEWREAQRAARRAARRGSGSAASRPSP